MRTVPRFASPDRPLIVFATHDCSRSGAPMVVLNLLREVLSSGAVEAMTVAKSGGHLTQDFAAVAPLEVLGQRRSAAEELDELLTALDSPPRAAFCNSIVTADLVPVFRRYGVPVLSLIHEMPSTIRYFGEDTIRTIDRYANAVVFGSKFVRDRVLMDFSCTNPNVHVVPTGYPLVDLDEATAVAARRRLRREVDLPDDAFVVLGCGSIEHRKGVDLVPQIAKALRPLVPDALVRFVWIGQDVQDLYSTWLRHDAALLDVADMVRFPGPCADIDEYVPGADVFVLPSREDPFPLVALAALGSGVPVIAFSGAGGAPEAIGHEAGLVVPYLDVLGMSRVIAKLVADQPLRARLGAAARQRFKSHYSMRVFARRLLDILQADADVILGIDLTYESEATSAVS
jgi:glycosyltransferase involved in cell wall biosynthesis